MKDSARQHRLSFRGWLLIILAILIIIIAYFIVADRITPSSNDAYVQAYVVQIAPQVSGRVVGLYVSNNSHAKKDAVLFTVDPRPYIHRVNQLEAELVKVKQEIKQLKTTLKIAQELIKQREGDLVYVREHFNEINRLVKQGAVSQLRLQQLTDQRIEKRELLSQAKSLLLKTQQNLAAMIGGNHARVKIVMAQLATAKLHLSETTVRAPFNGFVTNMRLTQGSYAKVGTSILTLVSSETWWVVANIKENNLTRVRPGQPVDVSFNLYPGKVFPGEVESIGRGVNLFQDVPNQYLPYVKKTPNWVRLAQRFPVKIKLIHYPAKQYPLNSGATALVTIYTDPTGFLHALAYVVHRIRSFFSYVV